MKPPHLADVEQRILALIAELSTVPPQRIRPTDRLREDLGLDSVSSMELLSLLAEEYQLDVEVEEAVRIVTVADTIEMARGRLAGAQA